MFAVPERLAALEQQRENESLDASMEIGSLPTNGSWKITRIIRSPRPRRP
jgi:hypothetical protein